jgi:uncharacterized protein (DUF58 family)
VLPSSTAAALDDLELAARLIVEGTRSGQHRSPFHGFTAEFSQHRPYRPGDDLKHLDWKLLGRTDRLYSRQFRETTNLSVMLAIDTSASMDYGGTTGTTGTTGNDGNKFRYAVVTAAALAHVIIDQGDAVGLMAWSGDKFTYVPARGGRPHRQVVFAALAKLKPADRCPLDRLIARGGELLRRRGVLIALSDFYDATEETLRELRRTARRGHDLTLFQIVSKEELTFPYSGSVEFDDLETSERRVLDAAEAAAAYRSSIGAFVEGLRRDLHRDGHEHVLMPTDVPVESALRSFLVRRSAKAAAVIGAAPGLR